MGWIGAADRRVMWVAPLLVTSVAITVVFILLLWSPDFGYFASLFLVVPLACGVMLILVIRGRRRTRIAYLALLCVLGFVSWQMLKHSDEIRCEMRWLAEAQYWKARVLQEAADASSGLKAVEWDGWGMLAQDTDVYLVFSPDDGLRHYSPTNLSGLPCPVWQVQRLEKQWYSVTFYTDEVWNYCSAAAH